MNSVGGAKLLFGTSPTVLEADRKARPLSPFDEKIRSLPSLMSRTGERLPLVVGTYQEGSFRASVAFWTEKGEQISVSGLDHVLQLVESWNGQYPDPADWQRALARAQEDAESQVKARQTAATDREKSSLRRQIEAARMRLKRELGRYLVCVSGTTAG